MIRFFMLCLSLTVFYTNLAFAELPYQVEQDFAVNTGTVIMPMLGSLVAKG